MKMSVEKFSNLRDGYHIRVEDTTEQIKSFHRGDFRFMSLRLL